MPHPINTAHPNSAHSARDTHQNRKAIAETVVEADSPGSSQQIPWNPSCPNLASFVIHGVLATHHPSLPSEPPDDGQCLCACRSQNAE